MTAKGRYLCDSCAKYGRCNVRWVPLRVFGSRCGSIERKRSECYEYRPNESIDVTEGEGR